MGANGKIELGANRDHLVLAYLAGIIDADGYITINRSSRKDSVYHGPRVGISGTRREPHDLAASLWGGNVGLYLPKNLSHRGQYQWSRQGSAAAAIIDEIEPFLRIKQDQALLALELWTHIQEGRYTKDDPYPWFGPHYDPIEARDELRSQMIDLNQSRSRARVKFSRAAVIEHSDVPSTPFFTKGG